MKPIILAAAVYLVVDTCAIATTYASNLSIWFYILVAYRVALILLFVIASQFLL
jgi:hypothetical protein